VVVPAFLHCDGVDVRKLDSLGAGVALQVKDYPDPRALVAWDPSAWMAAPLRRRVVPAAEHPSHRMGPSSWQNEASWSLSCNRTLTSNLLRKPSKDNTRQGGEKRTRSSGSNPSLLSSSKLNDQLPAARCQLRFACAVVWTQSFAFTLANDFRLYLKNILHLSYDRKTLGKTREWEISLFVNHLPRHIHVTLSPSQTKHRRLPSIPALD